MLELAFRPDRRAPAAVFRQLAECLRGWIETGRLAPGEKLPATRDLAASLGLSRNTVMQAYLALGELGLVASHVGQGTFVAVGVAAAPHGAIGSAATPQRVGESPDRAGVAPGPPARSFAWGGLFALRARDLPFPAALRGTPGPREIAYDFRGGRVDPATLPGRAIARATARAIERHGASLATFHDPFGWPALREHVARGLLARGIACEPADVAIVGGAQQALDLVGRVLIDPGDTVVMEQPGYFGAALAFGASGANLVGVPVDREGLRTDVLARLLRTRRVKLVYATPAVQCPTGVSLSEERRRTLLDLADRHETPVLDDDYDGALRLGGPARPALKALDRAGQVISVGTFTKTLFPGFRVGWVVAARPLLERIALAHLAADFQTSPLAQAALVELLASGAFERHVRRVRRLYAERLRALEAAVAEELPAGTEAWPPAGGNALWLRLPAGVDADALLAAARAAGIAYARGDAFHLDGEGRDCIALSFAALPADRIAEGVRALGRLVRENGVRAAAGPARPSVRGPRRGGRLPRVRGRAAGAS